MQSSPENSEPRSNAWRWLFLAAAAVALLVAAARLINTRPAAPPSDRAGLAEVNALNEMARRASIAGDNQKAIEYSNESARKLQALAQSASGDERTVMQYASELAAKQNGITQAYVDAAAKYVEAGEGRAEGLKDEAAVDRRLALIDRTIQTHGAFVAYFAKAEEQIATDLQSRGVGDRGIREFVEGFRAQAKVENLLRIHALQSSILERERERLVLLKSFPAQWKVVGERIEFGSGVPQEKQARFAALGEEGATMREKMLALVRDRNAPK